MRTSLKKCTVSRCGCGPSDCQNWAGFRLRRASTPQEGLCVETDHEAREEISRRPVRKGSWAEGGVGEVLEGCCYNWGRSGGGGWIVLEGEGEERYLLGSRVRGSSSVALSRSTSSTTSWRWDSGSSASSPFMSLVVAFIGFVPRVL